MPNKNKTLITDLFAAIRKAQAAVDRVVDSLPWMACHGALDAAVLPADAGYFVYGRRGREIIVVQRSKEHNADNSVSYRWITQDRCTVEGITHWSPIPDWTKRCPKRSDKKLQK